MAIPKGTIKATCLIETVVAAFEMDEFLWELKEHSAGLNIGRWDYIFSCIKAMRNNRDFCLADRSKIVMTVGADNKVVPKPVKLGPMVDGLRVIRSGLTAADKVIITGVANPMVRPGGVVTPQPGEIKFATK